MNLSVLKFIVFCGCIVISFAGTACTASTDCKWPDAALLKKMGVSSPANGMTTPKRVGFRESVAVGMTEYTEYDEDQDCKTEHVNTTEICRQSLKEFTPRKEEDAQPRESAYNFVASINFMLYENGIPTDNPLIREAVKDRVLKIAKGIQGDFFVNRAVAHKEGSPPRLHILEENFLKIAPETVEKMRAMGGLLALEDCLKIKEIARNNPSVIAALIALEREKFDIIAELNKRNISITADIFDAVSCKANTLTTDEIDLFLHFSVGNHLVFLELFKMPYHRVQDFKNILAQSTMEPKKHRNLLKKTADFVLQIAQGFAPGARLYASDALAFSLKFLSRNELSTYELIDFARVVIKRKSWWALMWTWVDHDTLHDLCDRQRSTQSS
jgi:hypothetical protein